MMLLPGHTPATQENGIRPEEDRLMQWTPKTMAPKTPIVLYQAGALAGVQLLALCGRRSSHFSHCNSPFKLRAD